VNFGFSSHIGGASDCGSSIYVDTVDFWSCKKRLKFRCLEVQVARYVQEYIISGAQQLVTLFL
jgi:hypothetical protein